MISAEEMQAVIARATEVDPTTGCWLWARGMSSDGYGSLGHDGWPRGAHRASWLAFRGNLPHGLMVRHRCDTPACVNPAHLELGTRADNVRDMVRRGRSTGGEAAWKARDACANGHPISEATTYRRPGGKLECLICRREGARRARKNRASRRAPTPYSHQPPHSDGKED